jgi:ribulose-phosphate 3-epimerase
MSNPIIAPSILSADFGRLHDALTAIETAGADWVHVDVMDGHFVPNLTFGPPVIKAIRGSSTLPFDVHLMIEKPELSIAQYADAGADRITVHAEACPHLHRTLSQIKESGAKSGVALNPSTPASAIENVLHLTDMVLVMTVNPGFGGQAYIPTMLDKIRDIRAQANQLGLDHLRIQVDGGISPTTIAEVAEAGADVFVAGSAIFKSDNYAETIQTMRQLATPA